MGQRRAELAGSNAGRRQAVGWRGHQLHLAADDGTAYEFRSADSEDERVVGRDVGRVVDPEDVDDYSVGVLALPDDVPDDVVIECCAELLPHSHDVDDRWVALVTRVVVQHERATARVEVDG